MGKHRLFKTLACKQFAPDFFFLPCQGHDLRTGLKHKRSEKGRLEIVPQLFIMQYQVKGTGKYIMNIWLTKAYQTIHF
jgi:hypothetical protein